VLIKLAVATILLTEGQRLQFTQIPQNISEYEIEKYKLLKKLRSLEF